MIKMFQSISVFCAIPFVFTEIIGYIFQSQFLLKYKIIIFS